MEINLLQAIVLGVVEGLTEFLPISSTGHLIIAQKLFGINEPNEFFTVVVQSGAIFSAIYYFRHRILNILTTNRKLIPNILLGISPILIIGFLLRKQISPLKDSIWIIILSTFFGGIFLYLIELYYKKQAIKTLEVASKQNFIITGLFQSISLIPGMSRSGMTIAGGLSQGIKTKDSIELAFLMGIPVILIVSLYQIFDLISETSLTNSLLISTLVGTITSFFVGLLGIRITLGWVQKYGFKPFMIYRIILTLILLLLVYLKLVS